MPKLEDYLTIKQAAAFLGVAANTLRNWGASGKIPMHRNPMNGYRLFKVSDLEQLLAEIEASDESKKRSKRTRPK